MKLDLIVMFCRLSAVIRCVCHDFVLSSDDLRRKYICFCFYQENLSLVLMIRDENTSAFVSTKKICP